ncbi:UDP-glucose/GDP-mannose dehydrogenase family protein [Patescibacteria group bacterium]|nr:MAG: UDP-glucose/GDP-mannose dehydrogenase family protein [Patescibacteria group bacterium]
MENEKTITIIGAGFVGLSTAAIMSNVGYKVYLLEINPKRLDIIKQGRSFFYEQGINPLIQRGIENKKLIPTDTYDSCVPESDIIFSCVGTPDNPDGSSNLTYVYTAAESAAKLMKPGTIFVQKSTVPVGTGTNVSERIRLHQSKFSYVSNPEFLREGTALFDSLYFDRIVVGGDDPAANKTVLSLYKTMASRRHELAKFAGVERGYTEGTYVETNLNGAELVKVTANAFLALKISFANSIAKLADAAGADVNEIMDAVGADRRIGRAFLNAGRGYGGGCFPKDVSGLVSSAEGYGVDMPILVAATDTNESMPGYIASKAQAALGGLSGKQVAVLGLAFKAGTSDARRSPGILLANILRRNGATVRAFDPQANEEARDELHPKITITDSVEAATKQADAVVVATDWPEFIQIDLDKLAKAMHGKLVVDAVNCYPIETVKRAGLIYVGVGRNGDPA